MDTKKRPHREKIGKAAPEGQGASLPFGRGSFSKALRAQVLLALRELLSGFDAARRAGPLPQLAPEHGSLRETEQAIYPGLVTVVLRLVFVFFAEDHGLLSGGADSHAGASSLTGIHERLRLDFAAHGAALDSRQGAWGRVVALFRRLHEGGNPEGEAALPPRGGRLFDPALHPFLEGPAPFGASLSGVSDGSLLRTLECLRTLDGQRLSYCDLEVEHIGAAYEGLMGFEVLAARGPSLALLPHDVVVDLESLAAMSPARRLVHLSEKASLEVKGKLALAVKSAANAAALGALLAKRASPRRPGLIEKGTLFLQPGEERRRFGAHYTSRALTRVMVERTLAPLLREAMSPEQILSLKICDPAMGSGAFLLEACRYLASFLARAWERTGGDPALPPGSDLLHQARRAIAQHCLYGVDKNPLATELARASLWLLCGAPELPFTFVDHGLRSGDSLLSLAPGDSAPWTRALRARHVPFHWESELPEVFQGRGGFDAILGNPPWVSYAGRAAQPLSAELRSHYLATSPAFRGYRNLQALFVHRAALLLRPGGRLGFVLPTSMSDLNGYEPSRSAHDALCDCDPELPDFGDAFDDVFQPSMGLLSTRRASPRPLEKAGVWPLERRDLDPGAALLLAHLSAFPKLPAHLFGERGLQTMGDDVRRLRALAAPEGRFTTGVRVGGDIEPCLRRPPRLHCDPSDFDGRFRSAEEWQSVRLLIRQTARYPIVTLSDGGAFRNSLLAGFADAEHPEHLMLALLCSNVTRWYHYYRHRDARQGMPQMKIGHLRAFPDLPREAKERGELARLGAELGARNTGIAPAEQHRIDALVVGAFGLDEAAHRRIAEWAVRVAGSLAEPVAQ